MNILMIDDESNFLRFLRTPLSKYGHSVALANNGEQGWEIFIERPNAFDVIVTAVEMPVLNGVDFLNRLREKDYDIPVIVMTRNGDIQYSIEALRLGAFDFLLKPFKVEDLLAILNRLEAIQANEKKPLENISNFTELIHLSIRSQTQFISSVVSFLQDRLKVFCKLHDIDVRNIGLCIREVLVNAIVHGNLEIPSTVKEHSSGKFEKLLRQREALPEFADREVMIRCQITQEHLTVEIEDQGKGFDPDKMRSSDPKKMLSTGRGMFIITSFMDEVFWNDTGTRITMIKALGA